MRMPSLAHLLVAPLALALASATLQPKQNIIIYDESLSSTQPDTFSVHIESSASRRSEHAQVDISITFSKQKSREAAKAGMTSSLQKVETCFKRYITEDAVGSYAVDEPSFSGGDDDNDDDDDDDDTYYQHIADFDKDGLAVNDRSPQPSYFAHAYARANFFSLTAFDSFRQEFANDSSVRIDWVRWSLSPDSARAATKEARQLAVKDAMAAGQDYAEALGIQRFRLVSLKEESVYEGMGADYYWRESEDYGAAGNVTMTVNFRAVMAPV